jgi:enoyl-CoA hydratase
MTQHPAIRIERRENVTLVTLDDGKANALSSPVMNALRHTLVELAPGTGAIVLSGRAGFFSAGLDVKLMPTISHAERVEMVKDLGRLLLDVFLLGSPVVAAVTGHALGGGALLALACDVRLVADAKLRFGLNEVTIGLSVPSFGVEVARAAIPTQWHIESIVHGTVYTPEKALSRGIVESVHAPEALLASALARAEGLAALAHGPYETTKRRLRGAAVELVKATLDDEIDGFLKGFAK